MTRIFLILLAVLLPLRGWSAEFMLVATSASDRAPLLATKAVGVADMPAGCPMIGKTHAPTGSDQGTGADDGKACNACQLCMALALLEAPRLPAVLPVSRSSAARHTDRFVSAVLARAAEPPIF